MKVFEIGTGFTAIPAKIGAATEVVVENLIHSFSHNNDVCLIDIKNEKREGINCPVVEIKMPNWLVRPSSFLSIKHKLKRIIYSIKLAFRIKGLINKNPDAVFHFHNQYNFAFTYFICFLFKKKKKSVLFAYTIHTPLWSQDIQTIHQFAKKKYFLEIYSIKHADIVIALNPHIKENINLFLENKLRGNLVVIPNGVNNKTYHTLKSKKEYPLSLISVGSVCERKNQLETIRTLLPVMRQHNIHYYFAGALADTTYVEQINSFVQENNLEKHITYLGELTPGADLNRAYNLADIYISNSQSEAFSLVILEAMAAGLPLLLSDSFQTSLEGIPETNSIVFCHNPTDFQNQINIVFKDKNDLDRRSEEAIRYINSHFSWDQIVKLHEQAFQSSHTK